MSKFGCAACQDEMAERLQAAEEDSAGDESSSSSSSNSSKSSNIGLKQGQKPGKGRSAKAKAKRKSLKSQTQKARPEDSAPSEATTPEKAEKAEKPIGASAVLERSKAGLSSLREATPFSMWSNSIKQKDINMRLSKGLDCSSKCEGFPAEPALTEILPLLTEEVNRVSRQSDILNQLSEGKGADLVESLQKNKRELIDMLAAFKPDDITSFLNDLGRKLCEHLIASDGTETTFFEFISVKSFKWSGFGFTSLHELSKEEITPSILQSQQTLVNCFLDRFRSLGANTEAVTKSVPIGWFLPELCRTPNLLLYFAHPSKSDC